jgi:hypothetical protein
LIDVQQTLIETNPNPLKNIAPLIREKPIKIRYQSTSFFLNPIPEKNNIPRKPALRRVEN